MQETQVRPLSWEVGHDLATKPSPPGRREQGHGERLSFTKHSAAAALVSNSVQPLRRQPTRLRHPWDSPGKNTGVGCHFLLQCVKVKSLSRARLFATPWTAAYQASPSMGFSRQEYWSGVPLPSPTKHSRFYFSNHCKVLLWFKFFFNVP